jgi:predicted TIM-barrel fold metal-dependent hydrolase
MLAIDADAHVEESVETWKYLDPALHAKRPIPVTLPTDTQFSEFNAVWIIDNKIRQAAATPTTSEVAKNKGIGIGAQELTDVPARLADLDAVEIQKQVIYPSAWIGCMSDDPELEAALASSYNEFMATQCAQANGRLWYAAVVPYRRPDLAVAEIRRVKERGSAASIFTRGMEWDMPLNHPSFLPIYEEAERQDLAIAVHIGFGSPAINRMFEGLPRLSPRDRSFIPPRGRGLVSALLVHFGFISIMEAHLPEQFPRLRWTFLEVGSEWLTGAVTRLSDAGQETFRKTLADGRFFISCEPPEDIPYLMSRFGEECFVVASDYPHADEFRHDRLEASFAHHELSDETLQRLLWSNPGRCYGI